jgi:biopolymer transport protein ExbB/TolQ
MDITTVFVDFARLGAAWVMWLLVGLSVFSIGVMVDRWIWFRGRDTDTESFKRELRTAFERGELDQLVGKYAGTNIIPIRVALRGVEDRNRGAEAAAEAMHGERARWRKEAERGLIVLGTLGNNVPFVGLFGTVLGIIKAFDLLNLNVPNGEQLIMGELAEALVATALGLLVAIPAVVAYNFFQRRLKVIVTGADECAHTVLAAIHGAEHIRNRAGG